MSWLYEDLTELVNEADDGQNFIKELKGCINVLFIKFWDLDSQGIEELNETELSGEQQ